MSKYDRWNGSYERKLFKKKDKTKHAKACNIVVIIIKVVFVLYQLLLRSCNKVISLHHKKTRVAVVVIVILCAMAHSSRRRQKITSKKKLRKNDVKLNINLCNSSYTRKLLQKYCSLSRENDMFSLIYRS